ncbi:hypothetical protein CHS0354_038450 [Potamilus streckersoni]|uniref:non-specific serine/threonine protein kinase n=1 Tax=Potamilus streckersoni TaxID=2493646 RepID=A0AAE0VPL1_9BIVA|nr:hypothetical protein CHS0354_038450 [Potamilus streckersoni]
MACDTMDEFLYERTLGEGAFGKVYLVSTSEDNGNKYAMKVINLTTSKPEERAMALQEAEVLRKFNHPYVLHYNTSFEDEGMLYIVTEYCPNGDLSEYLEAQQDKGAKLEEKQILTWFLQTAEALKYLHGLNALHRDLKSPNIFLDANYDVRLGDMGLTKVLENPNAKAVTFCGSPYYMSPEIFSCKPYDSKSDIWALGVIVYEMSTLERPFEAMLMHQLVFKIVHGSLPKMPVGYSEGLVDLITAMLSKDPVMRPTAAEIVNHAIFKNLKFTRPAPRKTPTKHSAKSASRTLWGSIIMGKSTAMASKYADDDLLANISAEKYKGAGSSKSKTVKNTNWNKTLTSSQVELEFTEEDKERTLKASQQTESQAMDVLALVIRTLTGIFPKGDPGGKPMEATRPQEKEAMLLRNIEQLQYYCMKVLDNDQAKFQKAYDILGTEKQDSKLEESLIKLLGGETWALIGVQLMYLKNFEYNIMKLQQQKKPVPTKTTKKGK